MTSKQCDRRVVLIALTIMTMTMTLLMTLTTLKLITESLHAVSLLAVCRSSAADSLSSADRSQSDSVWGQPFQGLLRCGGMASLELREDKRR